MKKKLLTIAGASLIAAGATLSNGSSAQAVTFNQWQTNEGSTGNYILNVTENGDLFDISLTVDSWNAEALGLFLDFGDADLSGTPLISDVTTAPTPGISVSLFDTDTTSNNCGSGCNLNGLSPSLADPDGEWEYVFRLGAQGFDSVQTWNFSVERLGLSLDTLALAGIRAQQLCPEGSTLENGDTGCNGSDKSFGAPREPEPPVEKVPEPAAMAGLVAVGAGIVLNRRKKAEQA